MAAEERERDAAEDRGESNGRGGSGLLWGVIGLLVVLLLGMWIWKEMAADRAEDRLAEQRERWEQRTREAVDETTRRLLGLAATPLGLAVRDEAMEENYGRIETLLDRMVAEPGVERALFATAGDTIQVSTDQSLVGEPLSGTIAGAEAGARGTRVSRTGEGAWQVVVPITGLNQRIGTLALTYAWKAGPAAEGTVPADTVEPGAE
ncbi:MAG: hypothetical protein R3199_03475 [Gemmatimonadota bacterium]|nr:hypothetical protein [Gemmatimonadota bacterium]